MKHESVAPRANRETIGLRVRPDLLQEMRRTAQVMRLSKSAIMELCLEDALPRIVSDQIARLATDNARVA